jgi:hypothetical protein
MAELNSCYEAYISLVRLFGVDADHYGMRAGSGSQGQSYLILNKGMDPFGIANGGHIGGTRREAVETLQHVNQALTAVAKLQGLVS